VRIAFALFTLLAGCATSAEPRVAEASPLPGHFETPANGFELDWNQDGGVSLQGLVDEFMRATGLLVLMDHNSGQLLKKRKLEVVTTSSSAVIPPEQVYAFVESLLIANGFVLIDAHHEEPRTVRLVSLETQQRKTVKRDALFVPIERIDTYRDHPAMLVSTVVPLPEGADPRTVTNAMRTMLTDANTQSITPVGNAVEITGLGPNVSALAEILSTVDASAPGEQR
jgi:hypothetical protein